MDDISKKALKCTVKSWVTFPIKIVQIIMLNYITWPSIIWITIIFTTMFKQAEEYFFLVGVVGGAITMGISGFIACYQDHKEILLKRGEC